MVNWLALPVQASTHAAELDQMTAFGAELTLTPSEGGLTTKKLILDMIEAARKLSQELNTYWTDQLITRIPLLAITR